MTALRIKSAPVRSAVHNFALRRRGGKRAFLEAVLEHGSVSPPGRGYPLVVR
eukprot:CAMPEP_0114278058 /NCGR_PEP_ID=MMETSP0059-20121206/1133_1 /TAXON_ID=36894 /ORGANISM="Pyramimonas parkeae, Strain CCMP726" /LENGTH=51 /DNA_ID=CAMNT_0001398229 /DNA_START=1185 /DNA_END=1336 /DNA_ORIENTATION=+